MVYSFNGRMTDCLSVDKGSIPLCTAKNKIHCEVFIMRHYSEVRFETEQDDNIYTGELTGKPANGLDKKTEKKEDK